MTEKKIAIYCSSSNSIDPAHLEAAKIFTQQKVREGYTIVYGCGHYGLMGVVGDTALEMGADVIGVIPQFMVARNWHHAGVKKTIVTADMAERKKVMLNEATEIAILPGGVGTMDEFFEVLDYRQLGLHDKPITIVNVNGIYDHLIALLETLQKQGFIKSLDCLKIETMNIEI